MNAVCGSTSSREVSRTTRQRVSERVCRHPWLRSCRFRWLSVRVSDGSVDRRLIPVQNSPTGDAIDGERRLWGSRVPAVLFYYRFEESDVAVIFQLRWICQRGGVYSTLPVLILPHRYLYDVTRFVDKGYVAIESEGGERCWQLAKWWYNIATCTAAH